MTITIAHILYRLDVGGMEMVLTQLIDGLPAGEFRHVVICLTECAADFRRRIRRQDVEFFALGKKAGKDLAVWLRLWRLLRRIRPDVVHSCNIAAVESLVPAFFASAPVRVHAEHGRDWHDLDGGNRKYRLLRRILSPLADCFVAVSRDLERWLVDDVGIPAAKTRLIDNGVDLVRFQPVVGERPALPHPGFIPPGRPGGFVIMTVGRLWPVKDHANLLRAFHRLVNDRQGEEEPALRLVIVGDGLLRAEIDALAAELGLTGQLWITGYRDDAPALLAAADLFVLPSLAEGTPLTILEAMAMGLPVVATRVGGVGDLVIDGETGTLVSAKDSRALARAMGRYVADPELGRRQGAAGRRRVAERYGLERMIAAYGALYREMAAKKRRRS